MRVLSFCSLFVLAVAAQHAGVAAAGPHGAQEQQAPSGKITSLSITDNQVTAKIEGASLEEVISAVARLAGAKVSIAPSRAGEPVTAEFANLPFPEAMRRIIGDNYLLLREGSNEVERESMPSMIQVLARPAGGKHAQAADLGAERDQQALIALTRNKAADPRARLQAIEELADKRERQRHPDEVAAFEAALQDGNEDIRRAAMEAVQKEGMQVDMGVLRSLSTHDASPEIRDLALDEIADRSGPSAALDFISKAAKQEDDPQVKTHAGALLKELKYEQKVMDPVRYYQDVAKRQQE
jgi:hypothetical protein